MKRSEIAGLIRAMDNELKMQYGDVDIDPEVEAAVETLQSEPEPLAVGEGRWYPGDPACHTHTERSCQLSHLGGCQKVTVTITERKQ